MSKLYFVARTRSEINIFGGTVYIDIDGKQAGKLEETHTIIEVSPGLHTIKMYKSHEYNTFIGFAEISITIEENKDLCLRYTAPMLVHQAGHIVVSDFISIDDMNRQFYETESSLSAQKKENDIKIQKQEEAQKKNNNALIFWIFIFPVLIGLLYFIISMAWVDSLF